MKLSIWQTALVLYLKIDPAFAARYHIEQALNNFYKLGLEKSAAIWKFEDHQKR